MAKADLDRQSADCLVSLRAPGLEGVGGWRRRNKKGGGEAVAVCTKWRERSKVVVVVVERSKVVVVVERNKMVVEVERSKLVEVVERSKEVVEVEIGGRCALHSLINFQGAAKG